MSGRIVAIDVLRGFALLGILLMNIRSFAMPDIVYANPAEYGNEAVYNRMAYYATYLLAHNKFMAIFSMLFGASILLFTEKLAAKGKSVAAPFFSRNLWLLLFGVMHLILIWSGDVLLVYAVCSFPLFFMRKLPPAVQLVLGLVAFFLPIGGALGTLQRLPDLDEESQDAFYYFWHLDEEDLQADLERYRGGYVDQVVHRWEYETTAGDNEGEHILTAMLWGNYIARAFGCMLIGMALFKWSVLTGQRSETFYRRLVWCGFGIGAPCVLVGLETNLYNEWDWEYSFFLGRIPNHVGTLPMALGYVGVVMLWCKSDALPRLRERLSEVGRMALTCYIGQSLIATFLFYGFGLGWYGYVDYLLQLVVVVAIWGVELLFSWWWLSRFQQGPLEWFWRCLTYFDWQPLR